MLEDNYLRIKAQISKACNDSGRFLESVKLVAVTKEQCFESLKQAYNLGIRDFAESYAQELRDKINLAKKYNLNNINWHFIGAIQTNKIKLIALANIIQSVGSLRHAELLSQTLERECEIFLQVNLSCHKKRSGFRPDELAHALSFCRQLPHLKISGLMTIAPLDTAYSASYWFKIMQDIRRDLDHNLLLSMGMSDDFLEAIRYSSNIIRLGRSLFGARSKNLL